MPVNVCTAAPASAAVPVFNSVLRLIWKLMGGAREKCPIYITWGLPRYTKDELVETAKQLIAQGHTQIKMAIAASANFPALVLSIFWKRLTTAGAQSSMIIGTVAALSLIYLSPTIQIDILHNSSAWFPLRNPGIVSIPLSFVVAIVVSLLRPVSSEAQRFTELERQLHLGIEIVDEPAVQ